MKIFFVISFIVSVLFTNAQNADTSYFDKEGARVSSDKAVYYVISHRTSDNNIGCDVYWVGSHTLRAKAVYSDTVTHKLIGTQVLYFKDGDIEDSSVYNDEGVKTEAYHYYPNKKMAVRFVAAMNGGKGVVEGYDESGQKVKNFIYEREAEFKGGEKAWVSYLLKNVNTDFRNTKSDEEIQVTVKVQFIVDPGGNVTKPKVVQSSGISYIDKDAVRVILSSPQWNSAVLYNKPVKAYRVQPITYALAPAKSKK